MWNLPSLYMQTLFYCNEWIVLSQQPVSQRECIAIPFHFEQFTFLIDFSQNRSANINLGFFLKSWRQLIWRTYSDLWRSNTFSRLYCFRGSISGQQGVWVVVFPPFLTFQEKSDIYIRRSVTSQTLMYGWTDGNHRFIESLSLQRGEPF